MKSLGPGLYFFSNHKFLLSMFDLLTAFSELWYFLRKLYCLCELAFIIEVALSRAERCYLLDRSCTFLQMPNIQIKYKYRNTQIKIQNTNTKLQRHQHTKTSSECIWSGLVKGREVLFTEQKLHLSPNTQIEIQKKK